MMLTIFLNDEQTEQLLTIYSLVDKTEAPSIEDYVGSLIKDLLHRIWTDIRQDVLN